MNDIDNNLESRTCLHFVVFCSAGLDVVEPRLEKVSRDRWHDRLERHCVLGVNIGEQGCGGDLFCASDEICTVGGLRIES